MVLPRSTNYDQRTDHALTLKELKTIYDTPATCDLMSTSAIVIQAVLALICVLVLIVKRLKEVPQRRWIIWILDVFKQISGMGFVHVFNIVLSIIYSRPGSNVDECAWYFIQYSIDVQFGTFLTWLFMSFSDWLFNSCNCQSLVTGNYFDQRQRLSYCYYTIQLIIWLLVLAINKIMLWALQIPMIKVLSVFSKFAQSWVWQDAKLFQVLVVVPGIGNSIQMWIQDTILKKKAFTDKEVKVRKSYFTANVGDDQFKLQLPVQSQKKSFISDINGSIRASRNSRLSQLSQDSEDDSDVHNIYGNKRISPQNVRTELSKNKSKFNDVNVQKTSENTSRKPPKPPNFGPNLQIPKQLVLFEMEKFQLLNP